MIKDNDDVLKDHNRIISDGDRTISENNQTIKDSTHSIKEDSHLIKDEIHAIKDGNQTIKDGNQAIKDGNQAIKAGNQTIKDNNQTVKEGNQTLNDGSQTIKEENYTIKIRYSQFETDSIKDFLVDQYNLKEPVTCRFYDYGMNDIYIINAEDDVFYLRISLAGVHSERDYEQEIEVINTLYENGISVAAPVRCNDGGFLKRLNAPEGTRYAVLFQEAKNHPSDDTVSSTFQLGTMIAKMHTIADQKNFSITREPLDLDNLTEKPLKKLEVFLKNHQEDIEYLKNAARKLSDYIKVNFEYEKPYYGFCHGDIHKGNVFFEGEKPTIFDFDCMGYGFRIYDVCIYAWNESFDNKDYLESEDWKAFLKGYNSIRQLSDLELSSISVFIALRELWLLGINADVMNRNAGCCWFNDDYLKQQIDIFKFWYQRALKVL